MLVLLVRSRRRVGWLVLLPMWVVWVRVRGRWRVGRVRLLRWGCVRPLMRVRVVVRVVRVVCSRGRRRVVGTVWRVLWWVLWRVLWGGLVMHDCLVNDAVWWAVNSTVHGSANHGPGDKGAYPAPGPMVVVYVVYATPTPAVVVVMVHMMASWASTTHCLMGETERETREREREGKERKWRERLD